MSGEGERASSSAWRLWRAALLLFALCALPARAAEGDVDPSFIVDVPPVGNQGCLYALAVQPDGKILLGGQFFAVGGVARTNLARLNGDGTLDSSFDPAPDQNVYSVVVQPDGKILVGGWFSVMAGTPRANLARLNPDGTLDPDFHRADPNGPVASITLLSDGKMLLAGSFRAVDGIASSKLARLHSDGTLDLGFNPAPFGETTDLRTALVQHDGKVLLGGNFDGILRLNTDGSLDTGFNPGVSTWLQTLAQEADGRILLGGSCTCPYGVCGNCVLRLNTDDTLDGTFAPAIDNIVYTIAPQADRKLIMGGLFRKVEGLAHKVLARFNPDGTMDPAINPTPNVTVRSTAIQADGKILLAGNFTNVGGQPRTCFARLLNGSATQTLSVPDASRAQWLRSGTAPEVEQVTFEVSTNGGTGWSLLGNGARIIGGWEAAGVTFPPCPTVRIRARGRTTGGYHNTSSGLVESVQDFQLNASPVAKCRDVRVPADATCTAGAWIDDGSFDPDAGDSITLTHSPPGPYPLGTTLVTLSAVDTHGASNSCVATVTVIDATPPQIVCPANLVTNSAAGSDSQAVTFNATVTDNCDPNVGVVCLPPSGSTFPRGTTTVQCVATDAAGNSSSRSFTVRVNARPIVTLISPTHDAMFVSGQPVSLLAEATDPDGDGIARMDFYAGTNLVGWATNGFSCKWTNAGAGAHVLSAKATDALGASGGSSPVNIAVLAQPPLSYAPITSTSLDRATGLFLQTARISNPTPTAFEGLRLLIQLDTNSLAHQVRVWNASGTNDGVPYVEYAQALLPGQSVDLVLEYYIPDRRTMPVPVFRVDVAVTSPPSMPEGTVLAVDRVLRLNNGSFWLEFSTLNNRVYYVQYSADLATWHTAMPAVIGTGRRASWVDNGPPKTQSAPHAAASRVYRILLVP